MHLIVAHELRIPSFTRFAATTYQQGRACLSDPRGRSSVGRCQRALLVCLAISTRHEALGRINRSPRNVRHVTDACKGDCRLRVALIFSSFACRSSGATPPALSAVHADHPVVSKSLRAPPLPPPHPSPKTPWQGVPGRTLNTIAAHHTSSCRRLLLLFLHGVELHLLPTRSPPLVALPTGHLRTDAPTAPLVAFPATSRTLPWSSATSSVSLATLFVHRPLLPPREPTPSSSRLVHDLLSARHRFESEPELQWPQFLRLSAQHISLGHPVGKESSNLQIARVANQPR